MRKNNLSILMPALLTLFAMLLNSCTAINKTEGKVSELIVGGDDVVMILNYDNSKDSLKQVVWQIKASEIVNLPDSMVSKLRSIDDHKSVDNNSKILISSSSGGVVLVDRETKECLFYTIAENAHSIEYLPNDRIVVALSTAGKGNCLEIYDARFSNHALYRDSLYSGHGVTWIESTERLYALGYNQLRSYSLHKWESDTPELKLEKEWILPETGGHELFASSDNKLLISTSKSVWQFNIESENFEPFEPLANVPDVKSVYYNDATGHLIYTKGEISWWTHTIHCKNPDKVIYIPEIDVYKVRTIIN